jgi:hypothetical protein
VLRAVWWVGKRESSVQRFEFGLSSCLAKGEKQLPFFIDYFSCYDESSTSGISASSEASPPHQALRRTQNRPGNCEDGIKEKD